MPYDTSPARDFGRVGGYSDYVRGRCTRRIAHTCHSANAFTQIALLIVILVIVPPPIPATSRIIPRVIKFVYLLLLSAAAQLVIF
ncbi:hypothetical protein OBBRIDRAFT_602059 [Obba rivulosa]|uniref:Uncharacterized protein n=1 Tax=Obba rivulosa TaxID=1052685 RepID=A0A8E2ASV6_9APHY|nr:hypothetical protein OBBRIDRAFT_602059 [Obba rivulosa]